jgi:prepilin-type N-terminal cleavage/methylation domain-containing protein
MHRAIQLGRRRFDGQGGFTLFEVVMVLLILGVISYFASTRLFSGDALSQNAEMELVKNHLRYAQSRAMNSESGWGIKFGSSTRYWLFKDPSENTVIRLPGVESADGVMELSGIQVTPPAGNKITFDHFGSPGSSVIPSMTVQPKGGGSTLGVITVTKNTGFIP